MITTSGALGAHLSIGIGGALRVHSMRFACAAPVKEAIYDDLFLACDRRMGSM